MIWKNKKQTFNVASTENKIFLSFLQLRRILVLWRCTVARSAVQWVYRTTEIYQAPSRLGSAATTTRRVQNSNLKTMLLFTPSSLVAIPPKKQKRLSVNCMSLQSMFPLSCSLPSLSLSALSLTAPRCNRMTHFAPVVVEAERFCNTYAVIRAWRSLKTTAL